MDARMPWGKYRHQRICDLPNYYLVWLVDHSGVQWRRQDLWFAAGAELKKRFRNFPPAAAGLNTTQVGEIRRRFALEHHPDRGGDEAVMRGINLALDEIEKALNGSLAATVR
jgi:hypothetical protein